MTSLSQLYCAHVISSRRSKRSADTVDSPLTAGERHITGSCTHRAKEGSERAVRDIAIAKLGLDEVVLLLHREAGSP
jgi:hypothetical protein